MGKKVHFASIVDGVTKKKDGTLSIKLGTQELNTDDMAQIFEFGNQQIWSVFAEAPLEHIDELEIPEIKPEFENDKSPSQRLRNVLYVYWEQKGKKGEFNDFYRSKMENFIEHIKTKLDD